MPESSHRIKPIDAMVLILTIVAFAAIIIGAILIMLGVS